MYNILMITANDKPSKNALKHQYLKLLMPRIAVEITCQKTTRKKYYVEQMNNFLCRLIRQLHHQMRDIVKHQVSAFPSG